MALRHPSGAHLLVTAVANDGSLTILVGDRYTQGTPGTRHPLRGRRRDPVPSDMGATTGAAPASSGLLPRSDDVGQALPRSTSWCSLRMMASMIR
jgi:hypothetical protein